MGLQQFQRLSTYLGDHEGVDEVLLMKILPTRALVTNGGEWSLEVADDLRPDLGGQSGLGSSHLSVMYWGKFSQDDTKERERERENMTCGVEEG